MSKWYSFKELKQARTPMPLDSVTGLPDNHVITVVERVISVDDPELIQNNVRTDTFTLNLDAEYDDLNVVVIFTKPNNINVKVAYNGTPTHIPGSAMELVGGLDCSVVGIDDGGEVRAVTKAAPGVFQVVESGAYDGSVSSDDAELLGQILAAMSGVEDATEAANTAASNANSKANLANTAASSANSAASSANSAVSSANSAAAKANTAATDAENAYDALQPVIATLDSNLNQPTRRIGPGVQVSGGDAFAAKPAEIVVYGNTIDLNNVGDTDNKIIIKISDEGKQDQSPESIEISLIDEDDNAHTLNSLPDGTRDELRIDASGNVVLTKNVTDPSQVINLSSVTLPQLPSPAFSAWVDDDTEADLEIKYVRDISEALEQVNYLDYNQYTGCYSRSGIAAFVNHYRDGKIYGYRQYKSTETALDRLGENASMTTPIPGTAEIPATDGYFEKGPFFWCNVNGKVDPDGNLDVTAIERDLKFSLTDPDGDVATLTPTLYYHVEETDDYIDTYICDSPLAGFEIQPGGRGPGGKVRPFMLHAKYAASQDEDGRVRSVSGAKTLLFVSHNSLITLCDNANTGYSAYNVADDWYIKTMFMLKYATKNSQSKFNGVTEYYLQYKATVAETGVNRVIISKSQANNLVVGSCCSLGTNPSGGASLDRGNSQTRDIFHLENITKIEDHDTNNSAVYFEGVEPFDTTTNSLLSTMPWRTGSCDNVQGDGSPVSGNSSKYPFIMQGIELGLGMYEIMGNVVLKNTGDGWRAHINPDSKYEKTAYNASYYNDSGLILPTDANDSWKYPLYCKTFKGGLISSDNTGGSRSIGMCDGIYTNKLSTIAEREWLSFGGLYNGSLAGLCCVVGSSALSSARWDCGSRLSFVGRSEG